MQKETSLLGELKGLQPGQAAVFPISRLAYVRAACCAIGTQWECKYRTHLDREAKTVTATRIY